MMLSRRTVSFCLAFVVSLTSQLTLANTKAELTAALNNTQAKLENKETGIETLESRLSSYSNRQADAQEKLDKAKAELAAAQEELAQAKASTDEGAAVQQELAQKKIELALNGLESRKKRLESTSEKLASLSKELKTAQADHQSLKIKVATLETQIAAVKNTPSAPAPKTAPTKPVYTAAPVAPAPAPIALKEPEPVVTAAATPATQSTPAKPDTPLTAQELSARKEMKTLATKTKGADTSGYRQYAELYIEANNGEKEELEFLGNGQYYGEIKLTSDSNKLKIRNRTFKVNVPDDQNGSVFVVIYDATNRPKPRFVIFNKNLLED
ncbi:hypothetical protein R50072_19710 [Simiduia litorea]|uniref:hypothetical protein n=1 Tax=Simiduia litorea TaxID=1435348 RepID=UPI0036F3F941